MGKYNYLPQTVVAYDSLNDHPNTVHILNAKEDIDYYCPCCHGLMRAVSLNSKYTQAHFRHITGECTKESRVHWFCKNWLFEEDSKFNLEGTEHKVSYIEIEKTYDTPFGKYRPDITVHTMDGQTILFEIYFKNRKTESDYFCKWQHLGFDVVEVDVKEYIMKTDKADIPEFKYLYHDGVCFCKSYRERDLYANTIGRYKHIYTRDEIMRQKYEIEFLDHFWVLVQNATNSEEILDAIRAMNYDTATLCYEIAKKKQCIKKLVPDILAIVNEKVTAQIRRQINLPVTNEVFVDLEPISVRKSYVGIRIIYETYNKFICHYADTITFDKNVHEYKNTFITDSLVSTLAEELEKAKEVLKDIKKFYQDIQDFIAGGNYNISIQQDDVKVLKKNSTGQYEYLGKWEHHLSIDHVKSEILKEEQYIQKYELLVSLKETIENSDNYKNLVAEVKAYGVELGFEVVNHLDIWCRDHINLGFGIDGYELFKVQLEEEPSSRKYKGYIKKVKESIHDCYIEETGYTYYVDKLKESDLFNVKEFRGKYDDQGIKIYQTIDYEADIAPSIFYIRKYDDIESIGQKFTNALRIMYEKLVEKNVIGDILNA